PHELTPPLMLTGTAPNLVFLLVGMIPFAGPPPPFPAVPRIFDLPTIRVDHGFTVAVLMAPVVSLLLFRNTRRFELRATGFSSTVARGAGMRPGRTTMLAMSISGGTIFMWSAVLSVGTVGGL